MQARYADTRRRPESFEVGDKVLLATTNLNLKGVASKKLYPKFVGPYEVLGRVGKVAYRLDIPATLMVHNVFHVSLLKKYSGMHIAPDPIEAEVDDAEYEIEKIIGHRSGRRGRQYLVQWCGYDATHNQWIHERILANAQELLKAYWRKNSLKPP